MKVPILDTGEMFQITFVGWWGAERQNVCSEWIELTLKVKSTYTVSMQ